MNEAVKLPLANVPAQAALLDDVGKVGPAQTVLRVVLLVENGKEGAGLLFSQHRLGFIGGAVNILGGPQQRHLVGPVFVEQVFSLGDALQRWTQGGQQFSDERVHEVNLVMVHASPSSGLISSFSGGRCSTS